MIFLKAQKVFCEKKKMPKRGLELYRLLKINKRLCLFQQIQFFLAKFRKNDKPIVVKLEHLLVEKFHKSVLLKII